MTANVDYQNKNSSQFPIGISNDYQDHLLNTDLSAINNEHDATLSPIGPDVLKKAQAQESIEGYDS